ncbi:MAG: hypothetical protein AB8F74_23035 [Saprospiraceae bacterium]
MKNLNCRIKKTSLLIFRLSLLLLLTNCSNIDETTIKDVEDDVIQITDPWICEMQSFEETDYGYKLYLEDNGDYIAVSNTRMLKVSKDGTLDAIHLMNTSDEDIDHVKIHNNKIYRFHYENFTYDLAQPIKLQIYDFDLTLLSEHILDAYGAFADAKFESDNQFVLLENNPDDNIMTFKKLNLTDGLISEIVLSTDHSTHPTEILILENGDYLCAGRSTYFVDNSLNNTSELEIDFIKRISGAKYISGQGIYVTGSSNSVNFENESFVTLLDLDGNEINSILYDAGERGNLTRMEINHERICLIQGEPESGKNLLFSILDYDLNIESTMDIVGGHVGSDIILNEIGSFSFVYGIAIDPDNPEWDAPANTRIFKFDDSYTLPTNIIIQ